MTADFEARGLLDGCTPEEIAEAAAAGRLALLPVERMLGERRRHSLRDAATETGLSLDYLMSNHMAIGLALPDPDAPVYDDDQLANLRVLAWLMEVGASEDQLNGLGRVLGQTARRLAEA